MVVVYEVDPQGSASCNAQPSPASGISGMPLEMIFPVLAPVKTILFENVKSWLPSVGYFLFWTDLPSLRVLFFGVHSQRLASENCVKCQILQQLHMGLSHVCE